MLIEAGRVYGRGANDMKGTLASCLIAIQEFACEKIRPCGSISLMLTSDEEIMGEKGTKRLVEHLAAKGTKIDGCVLCESCSPGASGEYVKVGCKGSLNVAITSRGEQMHVAQAGVIGNHIHGFVAYLQEISSRNLDSGTARFDKSFSNITSIDVGNAVRNIAPAEAKALLNIRFNDAWTFDTLEQYLIDHAKPYPGLSFSFERFGEPFLGAGAEFIEFLSKSVEKVIKRKPAIGTCGGNSDALFIRQLTDVAEIGSPLSGAHIANEYISLEDLFVLKRIYKQIMIDFFS
jgi:succinyl-diaminopimelate desuccinylase